MILYHIRLDHCLLGRALPEPRHEVLHVHHEQRVGAVHAPLLAYKIRKINQIKKKHETMIVVFRTCLARNA